MRKTVSMRTPTASPRTRAIWSALVALLGSACLAADAAGDRHADAMQAKESVRLPDGKTSVTLPLETRSALVLLPVSINGSEPFSVVLDTGMPVPGVILYDSDRVKSLKLPLGPGRARVGGAGGRGQTFETRIAQGSTLRIGEAEIAGATVTVLPSIPSLSAMHDGIIGMSVFRNFTVTIDHDREVIVLTPPGRFPPPDGATEVPLQLAGNVAYVKADLVTRSGSLAPLQLLLDLGATHPVSLNVTSSDSIRVPEGAPATRIGRGVSGAVTGRVGRIAGLVLGGHRLTEVVATFPDPEFENPRKLDSRNGNLGSGVLGRFNVTLDYTAKKMYLVPNRRFAEPFEWDMSGLVCEAGAQGELAVVAVAPGSPAAQAGIEEGDAVIALDGEPVSSRDFFKLRERFRRDGAQVRVGVRHGGAERTVTLRLSRLL